MAKNAKGIVLTDSGTIYSEATLRRKARKKEQKKKDKEKQKQINEGNNDPARKK